MPEAYWDEDEQVWKLYPSIPLEMWEHPPQPIEERPAACLQKDPKWPCAYPFCWCYYGT